MCFYEDVSAKKFVNSNTTAVLTVSCPQYFFVKSYSCFSANTRKVKELLNLQQEIIHGS